MTLQKRAGAERRTSRRRRTLKSGRIALNNMQSVVDCTVSDASDVGLRLEIPYGVKIPDTFAFSNGDRSFRDCYVIWRTNTRIGVRFRDADETIEAPAPAPAPAPASTPEHPAGIAEADDMSDLRQALLCRVETIQHQLDAIRQDLSKAAAQEPDAVRRTSKG